MMIMEQSINQSKCFQISHDNSIISVISNQIPASQKHLMMMIMENSNKSQKSFHNQNPKKSTKEEEEDKFSSLPDEIIHYILGFLPTEETIRASLLSTRWKYLWTSIPNLYFHDRMRNKSFEQHARDHNDLSYTTKFQNFVDRVLSNRDGDVIQRIRLECTRRNAGSCLKEWMCCLQRRHRVREVILEVDEDESEMMPCRFFEDLVYFTMLEVFQVRTSSVAVVSDSMCFSNLKVLRFCSICFYADELNRQLEFSFPILEEFTMRECRWLGIKTVKVYAPALVKLILDYFANVSWRGCYSYETEMKMDAVNLKFLSIEGSLLHEDSLIYSPSLLNVSVDVEFCDRNRLAKCVAKLGYVKHLTLSDRSINNLFAADIFISLQEFPNLISLSVTNKGKTFSAKRLINLLCYMPNIECLIIHLDGDYDHEGHASFPWTQETVPQCSLAKLRSVEMKSFNASENEMCLIAYLLLRTSEKMVISFNYPLNDPDKETQILTRIQNFPRGSPGTQVNVGGVQSFRAALKAGFTPARPGRKHRR